MEQSCSSKPSEVTETEPRKRLCGDSPAELPTKRKKQGLDDNKIQGENQFLCRLIRQTSGSEMPLNVGYQIRDGIRFLNPYWTAYRSRAKGRWLGRKLVDVFREEFLSQNLHYANVACKMGRIVINGSVMTDTGYVFQNNDSIVHIGHRHEHPILAQPIEIVADTEDLLVVNKPASMPVHPCGQYRLHTVLGLLQTEHNRTGLRVLHRLDRTTSGLLLFAKNYETDLKFKSTLKSGEWKKEYVCKVEGEFPSEEIICDQPIGTLVISMGIQCVRDDGKTAKTTFMRVWTDGKTSIVRCFIETGRTHQIRVHLQYLGFPIVDDSIYNTSAWGPGKGKNAEYGKSFEQLCKDISYSHRASVWFQTMDCDYEKRMEYLSREDTKVDPQSTIVNEDAAYDAICLGCHVEKRIPSPNHFMLHLHCLKYETGSWSFSTDLPDWAQEPIKAKDVSVSMQ